MELVGGAATSYGNLLENVAFFIDSNTFHAYLPSLCVSSFVCVVDDGSLLQTTVRSLIKLTSPHYHAVLLK